MKYFKYTISQKPLKFQKVDTVVQGVRLQPYFQAMTNTS